ncbi:MAG: cell filamentation protein Fic [Zetaproteobacteria bacterium]|nr:cell filamentation protein Fic [Zetaproteobacteria bacterium]
MNKQSEILIYQNKAGKIRLDVRLEAETIWLTQVQMAALFGRDKSVVSRHISNIFKEGELDKTAVVANFSTTAEDGKTYQVEHYSGLRTKSALCFS